MRPEVRLVQRDGRAAIVKDYAGGSALLRIIGWVLLARERHAYDRLQGQPGVPECLGGNHHSIVLEYVSGSPIANMEPGTLTAEFFARLLELVHRIHSCGVAHGDLKRLENIILSDDGTPVVLDFSAAFTDGSSVLSAIVMPYLMDDDVRAVYKAKRRLAPDLLTEEEERFLDGMPGHVRAVKRFLERLRIALKRLARQT